MGATDKLKNKTQDAKGKVNSLDQKSSYDLKQMQAS